MSKRISMAVAVLGAVGTLAGCNLEQPTAGCFVQDASAYAWQAKYILKNPADAALSCGQFKGEDMGVFKYTNPDASAAEVAENRGARIAIRPRRLASLYRATYQRDVIGPDGNPLTATVRRAEGVVPATAATGLSTTLAQEPDADGLCLATGFNEARVAAPAAYKNAADGGGLIVGAQTFAYQYENVEVYSAPSAPGTQMRGTVKITDDTCTAEYEMWALWPAAPCDPGAPLDEENCGPTAGVNPDFNVVCDPDLRRCVPAVRPPSFKPGTVQ